MVEIIENQVTFTTKYDTREGILEIIQTPSEIVPMKTSYNMKEIQEKLTKINNTIAHLESQKAPLQAVMDKYNEIKPQPEVIEEPIVE